MSALFLPALCIAVILAGLLARTNVYDAFVRGAEEGLATLIQIAPCLCAILSATALWRETGLLTALTDGLKPVFAALRLPGEAASVVLLRPLSGSAALAAVNDVIRQCGVDSRAARLACVISGASETVFFPRRSIWARRTSNVRVMPFPRRCWPMRRGCWRRRVWSETGGKKRLKPCRRLTEIVESNTIIQSGFICF